MPLNRFSDDISPSARPMAAHYPREDISHEMRGILGRRATAAGNWHLGRVSRYARRAEHRGRHDRESALRDALEPFASVADELLASASTWTDPPSGRGRHRLEPVTSSSTSRPACPPLGRRLSSDDKAHIYSRATAAMARDGGYRTPGLATKRERSRWSAASCDGDGRFPRVAKGRSITF